jgi:hypothetical protein
MCNFDDFLKTRAPRLFVACSLMLVQLVFLLLSASPVAAQDNERETDVHRTNKPGPFSLSYHQENDGPWLNPFDGSDRYYTHGLSVAVTHQPDWALKLARWLPFGAETVRAGMGYLFARQMHTPENLSASEPIVDDRPYAGYGYLGVALHRASPHTLDQFELKLGAIGPITQADEMQAYAHEHWGGTAPEGWENQLDNQPTAQLSISRTWRAEIGDPFRIEFLPKAGLRAGSVMQELRLGSSLRLGFNLPDDFGTPRFGTPRDATARPSEGISLFGVAEATGVAVADNRLISGESDAASPGEPVEPLVGELSFGGGVVLRLLSWSIEARYFQVIVSPQFQGQESGHRYGSALFAIGGPYGN